MPVVTLGLDLGNLGQDLLQTGIVEVACTGVSAVDAKSGGGKSKCEESSGGDHVEALLNQVGATIR